mmetsp:Transcript_23362/g.29331  ORF Transcript_23362/g.29331 Transcript_23362/m.29331 type:complete len:298 (+) Transcript_23362:197-1090(+)
MQNWTKCCILFSVLCLFSEEVLPLVVPKLPFFPRSRQFPQNEGTKVNSIKQGWDISSSTVNEAQINESSFGKLSRRELLSGIFLGFLELFLLKPTDARLSSSKSEQAFQRVLEEKYQEPYEFWNEYISLYGEEAFTLNNRGNCLLALGRAQEALEDFSKAILLDSDNFNLKVNRAITYQALAKYEEAISDYSSALTLKEDPLVYVSRGNVKSLLQDELGQMEDYEKALQIAPYVIGYKGKLSKWPKEVLPVFLPRKKSAFLDSDKKIRLLVQISPIPQKDTTKYAISSMNSFFSQAS